MMSERQLDELAERIATKIAERLSLPAGWPDDRLLVSEPAAARLLGIAQQTLREHRAAGEIKCVKIGRAVRYDIRDLLKFVSQAKGSA